jgi:PKHD-type hydroxylase
MNLKHYYWYFQSALPKWFCDHLIKFGNQQREEKGITGQHNRSNNLNKEQLKDQLQIRDSNVAWVRDPWILNMIKPFVEEANKNAGWNFQIDGSEDAQFTKYKLKQFYDWHCDSFEETFDCPNVPEKHGRIRKLSVTCSLSDPKDYSGGELEFDYRMHKNKEEIKHIKCLEILPKGSVVVFPSHIWHRVKPVTKGTRYSLVIWNIGYPFR